VNWTLTWEGTEPLSGVHHGRLAVEQTYGYMVYDEIIYGIISTFNSFIFMKRESPGILYMSRMIHINSTTPTIMKLLYFFSHLCARDPIPCPETNLEGIIISLQKADKTTSAAPKIPNPNISLLHPRNEASTVLDRTTSTSPRRSPRHTTSNPANSNKPAALYLDVSPHVNGTYLGCKGWRGTLSTGRIVFAKLWDGWKFSPKYAEHEAAVYNHLHDLWGSIVPEFLGLGNWGFCHILLLSYIEVSSPYCPSPPSPLPMFFFFLSHIVFQKDVNN
jgi:hypothetical protein